MQATDIIRVTERDYKENNIDKIKDENELIEAISNYPKILQRPIIINNGRGAICRPAEKVLSLI